ncbi:hypothetical protein F5Y08DRAFT_94250 [Xylaria arbuscula]|nr:hypothetical protein F5Y08DRAFT_94250 [Xylaria arbuscula]
MVDPFSILAGAVGVTDVAVKTSMKLRSLISDFRDAPSLILALSNEVTEMRVVLERVKESQRAVQSLHNPQYDAAFLAALNDQLTKAHTITMDLESLVTTLSTGNSPTERFRWLRKKKNAADLNGKLKAVRERMNELLVAYNPSLGSRMQLELHEVQISLDQVRANVQTATQTTNSNFQATNTELVTIRNAMAQQHTLVKINSKVQTVGDAVSVHTAEAASYRREINDQLSTIHNTVHTDSQALGRIQSEQSRQFDAMQTMQVAILNELATLSNNSMPLRQTGPAVQPAPSNNSSSSVVFFSLRLPGSSCAEGCVCTCHSPARSNMSLGLPQMLRAVVGNLFFGYTGYPSSSTYCNVKSCSKDKHVQFQASYTFPLWLCLRYAVHAFVEASTSGIFIFTLVARQRIPCDYDEFLWKVSYGTVENIAHIVRKEKRSVCDVFDYDGRSALHLALWSGTPHSIEITRLLLQNGANPDQEDDYGLTFRMDAAERVMLRYNDPDYCCAVEAMLRLSYSEVLDLSYIHKIVVGIIPISLSQVLQEPVIHLLNAQTRTGCTPLMYAAQLGNVAAVRALIDAGAEIEEVDLVRRTALHHAVRSKKEDNLACVDALLQAGSDYKAVDRQGRTPLHLAAVRANVPIGRRLIIAGADLESRDYIDATPIWCAADHNFVGMIRCLYDAGASLESKNDQGRTPLLAAIMSDSLEAAALLFRLGANAACVNNRNGTLLQHVACYSSLKTMRTLTDVDVRGQKATAWNTSGRTAQYWLDRRQPDLELREAYADLARAWCRPEEADEVASDEEDACGDEDFHDAVEFVDGDNTNNIFIK